MVLDFVYGFQELSVIKSQHLFCLGLLIGNCLQDSHLPFGEGICTVDPSESPGQPSHVSVGIICVIYSVFYVKFDGVQGLLLHRLDEYVSATDQEGLLLSSAMTPHYEHHPLLAGVLPFMTPSLKSGHDEFVLLLEHSAITELCGNSFISLLSHFFLFTFFIDNCLVDLIGFNNASFNFILSIQPSLFAHELIQGILTLLQRILTPVLNGSFDHLFFVNVVVNILSPHSEISLDVFFIAPHDVVSNFLVSFISFEFVLFGEIIFLLFVIL